MQDGFAGRRHRPVTTHAVAALVLTGLGTIGLWSAVSGQWTWQPWLAAWLAAINVVALGYYGFDKWQARHGGGRVPEIVLHGLAVAGGSPGAYAAMRLFRHKTIKGSFRLVFWLIVILQAALLVSLVYRVLFPTHASERAAKFRAPEARRTTPDLQSCILLS